MPYGPARICGCGHRVPSGTKCACQIRRDKQRKAQFDQKRPTAAARGYDSKWAKARREYLAANPWCERCAGDGKRTPATVVNHRVAHKGNSKLMWSRSNWEPCCQRHHNVVIQSEEKRSGYARSRERGDA